MPTAHQLRDIFDYVRQALGRHWRLAASVFCAGVLLSFLGTLLMPRSYYSEARLFVRFGRENQVDLTATSGQMVSISESRESEINSLLEILKSRAILDRVVEELGPEYILQGKETRQPPETAKDHARPSVQPAGGTAGNEVAPAPPSKAHQLAIQQLERNVVIWSPRKSTIIEVSCKADSPAVAQRIVGTLVDVYLQEHVRVHHTPGSLEFFERQTEVSLRQWKDAAHELSSVKDRLGIVTIEGRRRDLEVQVADVATKLHANQAELRASEAKIASLEQLSEKLPKTVVTQETQGPNAAFDGMRQTLYTLEAREHDLASKMQDNHPQLIAVRQQVADLRKILKEQPMQRIQATEAINPERQSLELALLNERAQEVSLQGRGTELLAQQRQLQADLQKLNGQEGNLLQLQQAADLAESRHSEYAQKLEQARISRSLDEQQISSLSIVQPASYVAKPVGPRRLYVLGMGLVLATIGGFGSALAAAYLRPVLLTAADLSQLLDLPLTGRFSRAELAANGAH
jgi:uncharacterized protein involved in exopolysaccharide biosynthesis